MMTADRIGEEIEIKIMNQNSRIRMCLESIQLDQSVPN